MSKYTKRRLAVALILVAVVTFFVWWANTPDYEPCQWVGTICLSDPQP